MSTPRATLHDELPSLEYIAKKVRPQMAQWKLIGIANLAECLCQNLNYSDKEKSKYPHFEKRIWVEENFEPKDLNTFSLIRLVDAQDLAKDTKKTHEAKAKLNAYIKDFKDRIAVTPEEELCKIFLDGEGVLGSGTNERVVSCPVPILQSARYVQAVFSAPSDDCIKGLFFASFAVVRELYVVCPPGWTMGSARANPKSPPTAFVTGECAKARGYITRSFELTAELLNLYFEFVKKAHDLTLLKFAPREWRDTELKRLCKSYGHTIAMKSKRSLLTPDLTALELEQNKAIDPESVLSNALKAFSASIDDFSHKIRAVYAEEIKLLKGRFGEIQPEEGEQGEKSDRDLEDKKREIQDKITFELSLAQVEFAMGTLLEELSKAGQEFSQLSEHVQDGNADYEKASKVIRSASMAFQEQATYMKKLLEPTERYLRSVIERELSAKDKPSARFGELVCAAAC